MAWMLGKDGKMIFVEPGTPVYGEIPAPLAMNIVNPQDGQALVYDGPKGEWVNGEGGGGGSFDPTITNPQDGQAVVYDATANKWKNGAVDVGWSVGEQQLFSETVTTVSDQGKIQAPFVYATPINYSAITVVFENHEYTCPKIVMDATQVAYGGFSQQGPDFSEYPFVILSSLTGDGNMLFTETAGTYTVAVIANGITVTDDFEEAVIDAAEESLTFLCQVGITNYLAMNNACAQKRLLYIFDNGSYYIVHSFTSESIITIPEAVESFVFDENGILQRSIL